MKYLFIAPLLFLFALFFVTTPVSAQEMMAEDVSPTASPSPVMEEVSYELPYPGMLPDNPLYFLKAVRDRIIEILISDPVKKAEFYLLTSDKRLNSGYFLVKKDKDALGQEYISKSNNYMHKAIMEAAKTGDKGKTVRENIKTALLKHEEIATKSLEIIDKKFSSNLQYELKRIEEFKTLIPATK